MRVTRIVLYLVPFALVFIMGIYCRAGAASLTVDELMLSPSEPTNVSADIHEVVITAQAWNRTANQPVPNATLFWSYEDIGGDASGIPNITGLNPNTTDEMGICTIVFNTTTKAGDDWEVFAMNLTSGTMNSTGRLTVVPGAVHDYNVTPLHCSIIANTNFTITITALDKYGNENYSSAANFSLATTSPKGVFYSIAPPYAPISYIRIGEGKAKCIFTYNDTMASGAGDWTLYFNDTTHQKALNLSVHVEHDEPWGLEAVSSKTQTATVDTDAPPFIVRIVDYYGNGVGGVQVNFSVTDTPHQAQNTSFAESSHTWYNPTSNATGEVLATLHLGTKVGMYNITVRNDSLPAPVKYILLNATATPGPVKTIDFLGAPTTMRADESTGTITVRLRDAYGNAVTGRTFTPTLDEGGGTFSAVRDLGSGRYEFTYTSPIYDEPDAIINVSIDGSYSRRVIALTPGTVGSVELLPFPRAVRADNGLSRANVSIWVNSTSGTPMADLSPMATIFPENEGTIGTVHNIGNGRYYVVYRSGADYGTVLLNVSAGGKSNSTMVTLLAPHIFVALEEDVKYVGPGDTIRYIIKIINDGNEPAPHVWVNVSLSSFVEYGDDTSIGATLYIAGNNYSWDFIDVYPGSYGFIITSRVCDEPPDEPIPCSIAAQYADQLGIIRNSPPVPPVSAMVTYGIKGDTPQLYSIPDLTVCCNEPYTFNLEPYVHDNDTPANSLFLLLSEGRYARIDGTNPLSIVLTYPEKTNNLHCPYTLPLTIGVSDWTSSSFKKISVRVTNTSPPMLLKSLNPITIPEDTPSYNINLTHYFFDPNGGALTYTTVFAENISVEIYDNGTVRLIGKKDWYGSERITFRAINQNDAIKEASVTVTVSAVNDPPTISQIPDQRIRYGVRKIINLTDMLRDVDTPLEALKIEASSASGKGISVQGFNLILLYKDDIKSDTIYLNVTDGMANATVSFNVQVQKTFAQRFWPWWLLGILAAVLIGIGYVVYNYIATLSIVEDVFLVYYDGSLIAHTTRHLRPGYDEDIFAGMLTAVQDFVKDSFKDEKDWSLNKLDFGDKSIIIQRGKHVYLAVMYSGAEKKNLRNKMQQVLERIEKEYGDVLEKWDGTLEALRGVRDLLEDLY